MISKFQLPGLIEDKMLVTSTTQASQSTAWSVIDGDYDGQNTCSKEADITNSNNYLKIDLFGVYTVKRVSVFQVGTDRIRKYWSLIGW